VAGDQATTTGSIGNQSGHINPVLRRYFVRAIGAPQGYGWYGRSAEIVDRMTGDQIEIHESIASAKRRCVDLNSVSQ
jgi:hypothetical protein